jgi:hypothetical protein
MPLTPAPVRLRQVNLCEFETSLVYIEFQDSQGYTEKPFSKNKQTKVIRQIKFII